jgi:anti-sigma B factor antagonist
MDRLRLTTEELGQVSVARLEGEVDKLAIEEARSQLDPLAAAGRLVIDLDRVSFIDSAGLHALFDLGRQARASRGSVALAVSLTSPVARVVEIVRLADAMPVRESVDEAAAALEDVSSLDARG